MRIDPNSFNPILGYKLDPGEPGLPYSAPASLSVIRVLSQELSNYMAFKKEAIQKGGYIIMGGIYLDLQKRGAFLAAVAGKTRVFIYTPGEKNTQSANPTSDQQNKPSRLEIERRIEELRQRIEETEDPMERERLKRELELLEMALNTLNTALRLPEFLVGSLLDILV